MVRSKFWGVAMRTSSVPQAVGSFAVFVISASGSQLVLAICLGFGKHQTLRPTEAPTTARLAKMSPFRDGEEPPWPSDAAI